MTHTVIDKLKQTFATADTLTPQDLEQIYTPDIVFVDPLGKVEGLERLAHYFNGVYKNVTSCRFDYLNEICVGQSASIKWDMYFQHPRLGGGKEIKVRGVSLLEFNDKIHSHEDIYDVGALMYENVPVIGGPVRWLKHRAHNVALKE